MSVTGIIIAAAIVAGTGLVIGLFLGVAGEKFKVEVDEKEVSIRDVLPGNNCGGCGYAGCDGLAAAIAKGEAPVNGCPVGGPDIAEQIGEIMGQKVDASAKTVAFVKCAGICEKTTHNYEYYGVEDCKMMTFIPGGGPKGCTYGCTGYGNCTRVCDFDAIHIVDGIAVVDKEKCVSCGKCIAECPKNLIEIVPYNAKYLVQCNSKAKGKDVKAVCQVGCIGCKMCEKACEFDAVKVVDNIAHIDTDKCTGCGKCAEKCPVKIITCK